MCALLDGLEESDAALCRLAFLEQNVVALEDVADDVDGSANLPNRVGEQREWQRILSLACPPLDEPVALGEDVGAAHLKRRDLARAFDPETNGHGRAGLHLLQEGGARLASLLLRHIDVLATDEDGANVAQIEAPIPSWLLPLLRLGQALRPLAQHALNCLLLSAVEGWQAARSASW